MTATVNISTRTEKLGNYTTSKIKTKLVGDKIENSIKSELKK